jgi:nucleoside-diphosphate-sugar epimerase
VERVAIFGAAGAIGHAVASELRRRGVWFRAVGRRRAALESLGAPEILEADLGDLRAASGAARGVDTVVYSVGVPYDRFDLHPKLMSTTVEAAVVTGVPRLMVVSSVYSYGRPETPHVAETHPRLPHTHKGRMRKEQEDIALQAQKDGSLQAAVVRLPDFYGPHAENSLANPIFRAALAGRKANWLGSVDLPHEFIFTPDAGRAIVELASRAEAYGEAWNVGGPGTISGREFIAAVYTQAGAKTQWRTAGPALLWVAGWFDPQMRELVEMQYLHQTPVILDDSKAERLLGNLLKTPYRDGIAETLHWMRGG